MTATLEVFEQIATDAAENGHAGLTIGENTWGGHQGRIVVNSLGEVYHTRITATSGGSYAIRKRSVGGSWSDMIAIVTGDAGHMLLDQRDNAVYLTVRASNSWYIYSSRDNFVAGTVIPGDWGQLTGAYFYGGVGIDENGLLVFKCEFGNSTSGLTPNPGSPPVTTFDKHCEAWFMSGKYNLTTLAWEWGIAHKYPWGTRKAYDYIFVNPVGRPNRVYGMAQSHGRYDSEGYLLQAGWGYVFNGDINYDFDVNVEGSFNSTIHRIADPLAATRADSAPNYLTNRPYDQLIDQKGRRFMIKYIQNDVWGGKTDALYLVVFDKHDKQIAECILDAAAFTGSAKLWEDKYGRVYFLHLYQGASAPVFKIYKVLETVNNRGDSSFALNSNDSWNLSSGLTTKVPQSWSMFIACPRIGNFRSDKLHLAFNFRFYQYDTSPTGIADATGTQQCYYARISF